MTTVGILGAGKLGSTLARLSTDAGHRTLVAGSGDPDAIRLILSVLAPDAIGRWPQQAAREADLVILALPLGKHRSVPAADLRGKIVIDAMNYWPPSDGHLPEFADGAPSSRIVAAALPGARVVKGLSHLGYHELRSDARTAGALDRKAIAIAGDDPEALATVSAFVDSLGFDAIVAGPLDEGVRFGPGTALFGASVTAAELLDRLAAERASG